MSIFRWYSRRTHGSNLNETSKHGQGKDKHHGQTFAKDNLGGTDPTREDAIVQGETVRRVHWRRVKLPSRGLKMSVGYTSDSKS